MSIKSILAHIGRPNVKYGEAFFRNSGNSATSVYLSAGGEDTQTGPNYRVLDRDNFTATWVVPDGVYSICAVAIGSGGSGEGSNTANSGSGGGGGGLVYINDYPVHPGQELKINVGVPGKNITDGSRGARGFPSAIYANGSPIIVAGGGGAAYAQSDPGIGAGGLGISGAVIFKGGDGGVGGASSGGKGGNAAGYSEDGSDGTAGGGDGGYGTSPYGFSVSGSQFPKQGFGTAANGGVGADYGGGGGGADDELADGTDYDGGNGGEGIVRIIWGPGRKFPDFASESESYGNVTEYDVDTAS